MTGREGSFARISSKSLVISLDKVAKNAIIEYMIRTSNPPKNIPGTTIGVEVMKDTITLPMNLFTLLIFQEYRYRRKVRRVVIIKP